MSDPTEPTRSNNAKFTTGSTMGHVLVMTSTASIGLTAIFLVDFADLYFLSLLGEVEIAAAVGYAGTILFFTTSISIGLSIATTALVSRWIGANDLDKAKRFVIHSYIFSFVTAFLIALALWPFLSTVLELLGATGRTFNLALSYLRIIIPSMPLLVIGMCSAGILRAMGDAKRAMYITLSGGAVNALLDPIFIFSLALGVDGAALASVCARIAVMIVGLNGVIRIQKLVDQPPQWQTFVQDVKPIAGIAFPAILTNIATPVGNAYVTATIADHGDSAVAGWAIIGRLIPVAFGTIFALSGAIGPILGQNLGAKDFDRVKRTFTDGLIFSFVFIMIVWGILALSHQHISYFFSADGEAAELIRLFCIWLTPAFSFMGALFVANAAFNNLGRPHYSTAFNWGRATLGTIPFVYIGDRLYQAPGIITGNLLGGLFVGSLAVLVCYRLIETLRTHPEQRKPKGRRLQRLSPLWPFITPRD